MNHRDVYIYIVLKVKVDFHIKVIKAFEDLFMQTYKNYKAKL